MNEAADWSLINENNTCFIQKLTYISLKADFISDFITK